MPDQKNEQPVHDSEDRAIWDYGRVPSSLEMSASDMCEVRKAIIRFALEHPIRDIRTYSGYKGDLLVEITTTHADLMDILKAHAESLGMKTVVKQKRDLGIHELYCISPDEDVYTLKPREE